MAAGGKHKPEHPATLQPVSVTFTLAHTLHTHTHVWAAPWQEDGEDVGVSVWFGPRVFADGAVLINSTLDASVPIKSGALVVHAAVQVPP